MASAAASLKIQRHLHSWSNELCWLTTEGVEDLFVIPTLTSRNWTMILDGETLLLSSKFHFNRENVSRVIIVFCSRRGKRRMICVFWLCVFCCCIIFLKKCSYIVILCKSIATEILHKNHHASSAPTHPNQ